MKLALVYDWVNKWGGAERVLVALHEIWPYAPLYTSVYDPDKASWSKDFIVKPSFLNKIPFASNRHELINILTPLVFESLDLSEYEVIISVTSASAKGIITSASQLHICYCLTPTRFLWSGFDDYFPSKVKKLLAKPFVSYWKKWDLIASSRPDEFIAISKTVAQRINHYYKRESGVIYPPIEISKFVIGKNTPKGYFLVVSRLVPYKKIDLVVKAFNELNLPLVIVGSGNQFKKLKRLAHKNIQFTGLLTDDELLTYYQNCRALIFPQEEDFGIVPLEAQACGKPVIAFGCGGAVETVIANKTGIFFIEQTVVSLKEAVLGFKDKNYNIDDCRQNSLSFSKERFKKEFKQFVEEKWKTRQ